MAIKILIPTALRGFAGNQREVEATGATVGEALNELTTAHADLKKHLYSDDATLRNFVNVYVNDEDIRHADKLETKLTDGDVISIVPSIAGGIVE